MRIFNIPEAHKGNKDQFCLAWITLYGGTYRNALRVYQQELENNAKKQSTITFKELQKALST